MATVVLGKSAKQNGTDGDLTKVQVTALSMLSSGEGVQATATAVGVSRTVLWRWSKLPAFQEALEAIRKARIEAAGHAIAEAQEAAVEALLDVARNGQNEPARVNAAKTILEQGRGAPNQTIQTGVSPDAVAWLKGQAGGDEDE
jgi:hypothetical protein